VRFVTAEGVFFVGLVAKVGGLSIGCRGVGNIACDPCATLSATRPGS